MEFQLLFIFISVWIVFSSASDECMNQPFNSSCASYKIPNPMIQSSIDAICHEMGTIPSCTVYQICAKATYNSSDYCQPFSILQDMCTDQASMMSEACTNFTSMCPLNSLITQCQTTSLPLPSSSNTQSLINSMCKQMKMSGCSTCKAPSNNMTCARLQVYSGLCLQMPTMSQCTDWKNLCKLIPNWPICSTTSSSSGDAIPEMEMYLHTGITDYVLFKSWVPQTSGQYAGTLIAVCIFGIFAELLKFFKCYCDSRWTLVPTEMPTNSNTFDIGEPVIINNFRERLQVPFRLNVDLPRAAYRTVEAFWGVMIMLLVMTFNIGIILSYCAGIFIGSFLFGRYTDTYTTRTNSACC